MHVPCRFRIHPMVDPRTKVGFLSWVEGSFPIGNRSLLVPEQISPVRGTVKLRSEKRSLPACPLHTAPMPVQQSTD